MDLDKLQLARDQQTFDTASTLFVEKWSKVSKELVKYFEDEWLVQNRNWYEGFRVKTPSTNNGLESKNRLIKDEHTLRERLDLSQFRVVLFSMVKQWSIEYTSGLNTLNSGAPTVDLEMWTKGYNFARSNIKITSMQNGSEVVYSIPATEQYSVDESMNINSWKTFSDYRKKAFSFVHATFQYPITADNWNRAKCDCFDGFKLYVCEHIVGIALRLKMVTAPAEAKNVPIGQKRKRGRPAKAKRALVLQ